MITLDEAIERELNIAHKGSDCWKHCSNTKKHCKDCIVEHRQNADWLKELKELRKIKEDYAKDMQTSYATFMYNKAIDDYMNKLCNHCMQQTNECYKLECPFCTDGCDIVNIAEKMKAGGNNDV